MASGGSWTTTAQLTSTPAAGRPVPHSGPAAAFAAPGVRPCDLVTVPARQGLEAVDILRLRTSVGPVLHDRSGVTLAFLVPRGTAHIWDVPGSDCTPAEEEQRRSAGLFGGSEVAWLLPPHVAAPYTDPAMLRTALGEAAVTLAAADPLWPGPDRS